MAVPIIPILEIGAKIFDRIMPDPEKKLEANLELARLAQAGEFKELDSQLLLMQAQTNINLEEAKSEKWWKAGWRPFIGWMCGVGFGYQVLIAPLFTWYFGNIAGWTALPDINNTMLETALYGLLGLGVMRSVDKGVQRINR